MRQVPRGSLLPYQRRKLQRRLLLKMALQATVQHLSKQHLVVLQKRTLLSMKCLLAHQIQKTRRQDHVTFQMSFSSVFFDRQIYPTHGNVQCTGLQLVI